MFRELHPTARRTIQIVALGLCILTIAVVAAHFLTHGLDRDNPVGQMFNMAEEANVPTWFASVLWLLVSLTALASYIGERIVEYGTNPQRHKFGWMWLVIAIVFFVASADEVATIHEAVGSFAQSSSHHEPIGKTLRPLQQAQDAPESPWIIYYAPLLIVFGLVSGAFLFSRFRRLRLLLLCCFLTVDCYALAIACDHFQGLPKGKQMEIANSLKAEWYQLLDGSIIFEETVEDIGTALLVIAFAGYAAQQISLAVAAERIAKAKPPEAMVE